MWLLLKSRLHSSLLYMSIKKLKYVRLPRGDIFVQVVMSIFLGKANGRVDFQDVGFVEPFEFCCQCTPGGSAEVVFSMCEHDGCIRVVDGVRQPLAQLRGALP